MGCGKTTLGRELQRQTNWRFIDTDAHIEAQQDMSVANIFSNFGEEYFRDCETRLLGELLEQAPTAPPTVIASGGGIVGREQNRRLLCELGFVVWLRVSFDTIFERVSRQKTRPLLAKPNPQQIIQTLLQQRTPWYAQCAHLIIDADELNLAEITHGIIESHAFFCQKKQLEQ